MDLMMNASPNSPQESIEDPSALQRRSSTSSSGSAASSHTRPRKAVRATKRQTSASDIQATEDEQSGSRRGSISSMRTSSAPLEVPVTYTPTTHRISKAKKGKRVHVCEFKNCNKIFTRAEHRRRHELNHSEAPSFLCGREGCRKTFHRSDLLQRHQERHELEGQTEEGVLGHRRLPSDHSPTSIAHSMISPTSMISPPMVSAQASSNGLSIPSLLHPQSSEGYGQSHTSSSFDFVPRAPFPMYASSISASDDFMYSSPESSQSPLSDHYGFPHRNSMSSSSSVVDFVPPNCASPLINTTAAGWAPVLPPSALPSNCNPLDDDIAGFSSSSTGASLPIPISKLDGHQWLILQRELASASGAVESDHSGLEILDLVKSHGHCLDCYWRHFHPSFPIVHQPTFAATSSALMTAVMIAIGSQYDTRTNAKERSLALLEACTRSLAKRDDIHSQSRLCDLQTVFLLEILAKFRSRKAEIGLSPRFRALFASLNHTSARHWISINPFAVLKSLCKERSAAELQQAHSFWVNRETRRRLLLASFILDTQQAILFEQQPALFPTRPGETVSASTSNLPCPCDNDLWECSTVAEWADLATSLQQISLSAATQPTVYESPAFLDPFRSTLILTYLTTHGSSSGNDPCVELSEFCSSLDNHDPFPQYTPTKLDMHFHLAAKHTPIRNLLTVSGESWLFGKKLENEDDFHAAKFQLREWVGSSDAQTALWHATALLRIVLAPIFDPDTADDDIWHPNPGKGCEMLHQHWCIYISALICWACAFDPSASPHPLATPSTTSTASMLLSPLLSGATSPSIASSSAVATGYPPLLDPRDADAEMRHFLCETDVGRACELDAAMMGVKGQTRGLLEVVRTRWIDGSLGGLMSDASAVLYRLGEGRSRLVDF